MLIIFLVFLSAATVIDDVRSFWVGVYHRFDPMADDISETCLP